MKGRANSAQSEWLRHPNATWRTAFPLFTTLWDSAGTLLLHEGRLLLIAAVALVAFTFGFVLTLCYFDPNGVELSWLKGGKAWSLAAVALVGVWTSLGRGDWHVRFPLGLLAMSWITVAHVAAAAAMGVTQRAGLAELPTLAVSIFAVSAFGGSWLRSLGRWQLVGPGSEASRAPLRLFQFSTASLFVMMMLTAAVLGLVQTARSLEGLVAWDIRYLDRYETRTAILVASAAALVAYAIVFGGWKSAVALIFLYPVLLFAADYFAGYYPRGASFLQSVWYSLTHSALAAGTVSLGLALVPLVGLRLLGFNRERTDRPPAPCQTRRITV